MDTNVTAWRAKGLSPVLLLTGIPGSGRSAASRALAARFDAVAHVDARAVHGLIARGAVALDPDGSAETGSQSRLCERNIALLADSFRRVGLAVLVDHVVVNRSQLEKLQVMLGPLMLAVLAPRLTELQRRLGSEPVVRWGYLDEVMRRELGSCGFWLDSSDLSPAATAAAIAAAIDGNPARLLVSAPVGS
jgi:hypothetical protein